MIAGPNSKDAPEFNDENINLLIEEQLSRLDNKSIYDLAGKAIEQNDRAFKDSFYEDWEEWDMDNQGDPL